MFSLLRQHVIGEIPPPPPSTSIPYFIEPYDLWLKYPYTVTRTHLSYLGPKIYAYFQNKWNPWVCNPDIKSSLIYFLKERNLVQFSLWKVEKVHHREQHKVRIFSMSNKKKNWLRPRKFNLKILLHRCMVFDELMLNEHPML